MIGWSEKNKTFDLPVPLQKQHGTLADWSDAANSLFAPGCESQAFALLASFAAPLFTFLPAKEGGAILSIVGGRRAGKGVAMAAAASVWALPDTLSLKEGVTKWMTIIAYYRNLPIFATNLANRDPQIIAQFLSQMLVEPWADYRTVLMSFSGERLNHELALELDLHVPRGLIVPDKAVPSMLEQRLLHNRGTAGSAYMSYLLQPDTKVWATKHLISKIATFNEELALTHEQRFKGRLIAAVWVAALICAGQGILEMSPDRIIKWALAKAFPESPAFKIIEPARARLGRPKKKP